MTEHEEPAEGGTIRDLQEELSRALASLNELLARGQLPAQLAALRHLAPRSGETARVELHYEEAPGRLGRNLQEDAALHHWRPESGYVAKLWFADSRAAFAPARPDAVHEAAPVSQIAIPERMRDLVRELDRAESGKPYVVLRWFLDTWLPTCRAYWSGDPAIRQRVLNESIEAGLVLTAKVENPKKPEWPSTTVRLDRSRPEVAELLVSANQPPVFKPVPVRGEPVSETIIKERR